jgi:hypothetical protein
LSSWPSDVSYALVAGRMSGAREGIFNVIAVPNSLRRPLVCSGELQRW